MLICPALLTVVNDLTHGLRIKPPETSVPAEKPAITNQSLKGRKPAIITLVVIGIATAASVWQMSKVSFEYDFRNLRSQIKSTRDFNNKVNKVFKAARDPAAVLIIDEQDALDIEKYLKDNNLLNEKSPVQDIKSICSIIPRDQEHKIEIMKEIKELFDKNRQFLDEKQKKQVDKMSRLLVDSPLTVKDIPSDITSLFFGLPGTPGQVLYIYQQNSLLDLHNAEKFAKAVGKIDVNGKSFHSISEPLVYLDVVNLLKRDSIIAVIGALLIIITIIFFDFGNIRSMLMVLAPLFIGLLWMFGLMGLFSIKLNIFNMVILPSLLGLGVDAGVHIFHRLKDEWGLPFWKLMLRIGGPNMLCTAINLIGFGGIVTAYHPGLRSIGLLAIIGMSTCLVVALSFLPAVIMLTKKGKSDAAAN